MNLHKSNSHTSTLEKLLRFKVLPTGWYFGRGEAISQVATENATAILGYGHGCGFPASDVFPGAEGEVMVTFYQNSHYIEVTIESPNLFEVVYEVDDDERSSRTCANVAEVFQLLSEIYGEIWRSHSAAEPLILHSTSTTVGAALYPWRSTHHQMEAEYLCLTKNVQLEQAVPFAIIYRSSTEASGPQEHIGDSTRPNFQMAHA